MKKKEYLMKELERLRKQQGEFTQRRHAAHLPSPAHIYRRDNFLPVADAELLRQSRSCRRHVVRIETGTNVVSE